MNGINWLISKAQIVENATDYTLSTFNGKIAYGMIRSILAYCKDQNGRYLDGKRSSGYNLTIEERDGYRKAIVFIANSDNRVEFQLIEEREA